jgi:hypothetical protein
MELEEFVSESLTQVLKGVMTAKSSNRGNGCEVNPALTLSSGDVYKGKLPDEITVSAEGKTVIMVNFDVAVTVTQGTGTKGGIGIASGILNLGSSGQSDKTNSSVSRLQFKVPVALPTI